jgi:capsular polysaccharide biosynthesis protein
MPDGMQIVEVQPMQDVYARKLWCAPALYYAPVLPKINHRFRYDFVAAPPARFARVMQAMLEDMMPSIGTTSGARRIFLARKSANKRKLINREAIEAIAAEQGFEIVSLEDLEFVDQIRLVRSARFVAGPEGSAFFVCFFARPGTRLCILNHPHTELMPTVTALMDALGVESTVVTGPFTREHPDYPYHGDYEIDEQAFASFLEQWLGSEATTNA